MASFNSKLVKKTEVANNTMAFYFEKPTGLSYIAGQHVTLRVINPTKTDEEGNDRTFSMITIPSDNEIGFATRVRESAFKQVLKNSSANFAVEIIDPRGSMVLPNTTSRPLVFLAGGIGITPFIGMVRQATFIKSPQKIYLFDSNRKVEDTPFLKELEQLADTNQNFIFIPTMTQEDSTKWGRETGRVNEEMIKKYVDKLGEAIFYLAGPSGFVNGLIEILSQAGVDSLFIKTEDFGEYK